MVRQHPEFNGIDYLEVADDTALDCGERQRTLIVHFINPLLKVLKSSNFLITGGERIKQVTPLDVQTGPESNKLTILVDHPGDFSSYCLRIVIDADHPETPEGYDSLLSSVDFSFKIECANDFDCAPAFDCPEEPQPEPVIDYMAKDYASFRRVLLDRLSLLMPQWQERHPADLGITLVELLAYAGDYLSYRQDAIATEAYLGTARRRISVRRHARLVDYPMHDGCNARVWVHIKVNEGADITIPAQTKLFVKIPRLEGQAAISSDSREYWEALKERPEIFETMEDATLLDDHNEMHFYTWGDEECCLPRGATRATLRGPLPDLKVGSVLVFQEKIGPTTGQEADANPEYRWAVRLTEVSANIDPLGGYLLPEPVEGPLDVVQIAWAEADALPFPLCLSSRTDGQHGGTYRTDISIALGNIVLADHGRTIEQPLGKVPAAKLTRIQPAGQACDHDETAYVPSIYRPTLYEGPLTQTSQVVRVQRANGTRISAARYNKHTMKYDPMAPATEALKGDITLAVPAVEVRDSRGKSWYAQRDLLASHSFDQHFVAETEENGLATLRFGDDVYGKRPKPDDDPNMPEWKAIYRIGNGASGNIGAGTIAHIVMSNSTRILAVTNPMSASGGTDPERLEHVRLHAPVAFRTQERAVTLADYAAAAQRHPDVQRAVATYRWTGSWRTVFLSIDRFGGKEVDQPFIEEMKQLLERFRMEGQDVEIRGPFYVPLEMTMKVCVKPGYFWSDIQRTLLDLLNDRVLQDGRKGIFHADNFTFGQDVYLSPIYAAAQSVPGVSFVEIASFRRWGQPLTEAAQSEVLRIGPLEVARLDNNRNFPEHGVFHLERMEGSKR